MRRNPRKARWTKAFRKAAGKEMVVEGALVDFERRRNVPIRYDREMMDVTLKTMRRVKEVREKRERLFYETKMKPHKESLKERASVVAGQHIQSVDLMTKIKEKQAALKEKMNKTIMAPLKKNLQKRKVAEKMTVMDIDG